MSDYTISSLDVVLLIVSLFASAFFSGSEAVLMSVGLDRAKQIIDQGGRRAKALIFMVENPTELLTTILVGNNVANIYAASLTTTITSRVFKSDAIGLSVGLTTFAILIFGEIIPKTFSRTHAESLSVFVIRVLQGLYYAAYPLIFSVVWFIEKVLGKNAQLRGRLVTRNDIEYMINRAEKEKSMDSQQIELLSSILEFPSIRVRDIMVHRNQVKYLSKDMSYDEIINFARIDGYTRYPVCEGSLDKVIGFLHIKDMAFIDSQERANLDIDKYLKPLFFVYEHMKINSVFDRMNKRKSHMSLVKDENGLVTGIITLEDIVEEILGDITDEHDEEENIASVKADSITVPATISLRDLASEYDVKIPLNENYSTLAGFILDQLGNTFPKKGQIIVWDGVSFELAKVDEYEIRQVKIKHTDGEKHLYSKKESQDQDYETSNSYEDSTDPLI